jgi:tetratricopeptide (TPR) repeat protein
VAKPQPAARGPAAPLRPQEEKLRRRGLQALDEGRYDEAIRLFRRVLDRSPANLATQALLAAATKALERAQADADASLTNLNATRLPAPPFTYTLRKKLLATVGGRPPKLVKISEKRNKITDDDDWFRNNGLSLPLLPVPSRFRRTSGNLPPWVPTKYGNDNLRRAIAHRDHTVLIFGDGFLAAFDSSRRLISLFDLRAYVSPPDYVRGDRMFVDEAIRWGEVRDGVLYVSNAHSTYASSSKGKNAYITALDARSGNLLWRSAPLVCNSFNFLIRGDYIITGYGFTAEPDHLYVLDRTTGKTVSKIRLRTGPDYIIEKAGKLYVRTYNTDYVFDIK